MDFDKELRDVLSDNISSIQFCLNKTVTMLQKNSYDFVLTVDRIKGLYQFRVIGDSEPDAALLFGITAPISGFPLSIIGCGINQWPNDLENLQKTIIDILRTKEATAMLYNNRKEK